MHVVMRSRCSICAVAVACLVATSAKATGQEKDDKSKTAAAKRLFAQRVLPLLKEKCLACHGDPNQKLHGELRVDSRQALLKGGESGEPAIAPGKPDDSPLVSAIEWRELEMPPKENDRLNKQQIGWFRQWTAAGAPWPDEVQLKRLASLPTDEEGVHVATSGGLAKEWTNRKYLEANLWAYRPLVKPAVRAADNESPIDAILRVSHEEKKIAPAPPADRKTLIRRATLDLTGLPPTPSAVAEFAADPRNDDDAFADLIEQLLASPHYGEQWGRHWLDVVRYADSAGLANDFIRANAWRYRDYVVRSFNSDKPYDQFVREQIAGGEIDPKNAENLIAVGFLRMGPWELTGMEVAKIARQRFLDDVTDTVGQVFLSHPFQCARCHDHKFDPIPTQDYYRLQAVFATTQLVERPAPFLESENRSGFEERKYLEVRKRRYQETLARIAKKTTEAARKWCADRGIDYVPRNQAQRKGLPEDQIHPRHVGLEPFDLGMERISRKGLQRLSWEFDRYSPVALSVYNGVTQSKPVRAPVRMPADRTKGGSREETHVLSRGDPFSLGKPVKPGPPSILPLSSGEVEPEVRAAEWPADGFDNRRKALAQWIVSDASSLSARSIANRIWQWHFGKGLAGNPNNFGAMGKKVSHPELLDWLAATLLEDGWSIKKLHRRIMMSAAYRRSSTHPDQDRLARIDPDGASLAAFTPRRLTAEQLRDCMLAVSGELNRDMGGIPVRPEMNLEVALQPRMVMGTFAEPWQPSVDPARRHRRSIYVLQLRGLRDPFFEVFNQPDSKMSCEARSPSTSAPQVFSLLNSQSSHDRALAMAARLIKSAASSADAIEQAFVACYARDPAKEELTACLEHWNAMTARHAKLKFAAPEYPNEVVREAVEENTGERFEFREPLEAYADFKPDLKSHQVDARTRGLADVCLVLLNSSEFVYLD